MAENAFSIIGIELIAAAQGCDFHAPLASSAPLEAIAGAAASRGSDLDDDRYFHPDIAAATRIARGGGAVAAIGDVVLPSLDGETR